MSQAARANSDLEFQNAVDVLIERHGYDAAENRLLAALSEVRKRRAQAKRRGK